MNLLQIEICLRLEKNQIFEVWALKYFYMFIAIIGRLFQLF